MKRHKQLIPDDVLKQHIAIVGKTGSGKTYTAKGLVERLLAEGRRVCVLDPTGAWWGLRTDAQGKKAGYPVLIFGGEHADVPINEHAGAALGRLIAEQHVPAVIDLSDTMLGERQRFVEKFAESLYRLNKKPLHLVIDEADEFAPQNPMPDTKRMLGAIDRIVRRGRLKGFRVMMISQRPAVINKNVLTQANAMIAMRLTSPQDRKAIRDWIEGQADAEQGKEVLSTLARLQQGEGWAWAPEQEILARVLFPKIKTYDSSRTPDDDDTDAAQPAAVASVDVSAVREAMEQAVTEAEANDPARLRKKVSELEKRLARAEKGSLAKSVDVEAIAVKARAEGAGAYRRLVDEMSKAADAALRLAREAVERAETVSAELRSLGTLMAGADERGVSVNGRTLRAGRESLTGSALQDGLLLRAVAAEASLDNGDCQTVCCPGPADNDTRETLSRPQRRILDALAWWSNVEMDEPSRARVGFVAGIKPQGGHFCNTIGPLKTLGLICYPSPGLICLTPAGALAACAPSEAPDIAAYHRNILAMLKTGPQRKMVEALINYGPGRMIDREQLGQATALNATGGHFNNTIGPLKTLGLVEYPRPRFVQATGLLFPAALCEGAGALR